MIIELIKLLIHGVEFATKQAAKNQPGPDDREQLDNALFIRRATSITQYIAIATNAMIVDGKSIDDVKTLLISRGLHEDHFEVVIDKAQRNYKKWFNETRDKPALTAFQLYEHSIKNPVNIRSSVTINTHPGEDHGLHFCTLIGFKRYYLPSGRNLLYTIANFALNNMPVISNGNTAIRQSTFARLGGNTTNPYMRVVTIDDQRETVYPYLQTQTTARFYTEQIIEWDNGDPIVEAEIDGSLNRENPLCFFATDYAVNKHIYKGKPNIDIRLSAFAFELFEADGNTNDMNQNPKGFWPNRKYSNKSYFSFEGVIIGIKSTPIDSISLGCIMALKLVHSERPGSNTVIDAYITNDNIKGRTIQKGMLVKGILWFQGEIVLE